MTEEQESPPSPTEGKATTTTPSTSATKKGEAAPQELPKREPTEFERKFADGEAELLELSWRRRDQAIKIPVGIPADLSKPGFKKIIKDMAGSIRKAMLEHKRKPALIPEASKQFTETIKEDARNQLEKRPQKREK